MSGCCVCCVAFCCRAVNICVAAVVLVVFVVGSTVWSVDDVEGAVVM